MRKRELLEKQEEYFKKANSFFIGAVIFFILSFFEPNVARATFIASISIVLSIISGALRYLGKNLSN